MPWTLQRCPSGNENVKELISLSWCITCDRSVQHSSIRYGVVLAEAEAAAYLPAACELVGAPKYADLVRRPNACYEREKLAQRQDGSLETFCASYENNPLEAFDDGFYLLENCHPLDSLLVRFIRENPEAFTD